MHTTPFTLEAWRGWLLLVGLWTLVGGLCWLDWRLRKGPVWGNLIRLAALLLFVSIPGGAAVDLNVRASNERRLAGIVGGLRTRDDARRVLGPLAERRNERPGQDGFVVRLSRIGDTLVRVTYAEDGTITSTRIGR